MKTDTMYMIQLPYSKSWIAYSADESIVAPCMIDTDRGVAYVFEEDRTRTLHLAPEGSGDLD